MSQIAELIKRVEGLTGPDRETDARVWCLLNPGTVYKDHFEAYGRPRQTQVQYTEPPKRTRLVTGGHRPHADDWTASIDAVVALIERVLPGWRIEARIGQWPPHEPRRTVLWNNDTKQQSSVFGYSADAPTPALALLLALLRSMESDRG